MKSKIGKVLIAAPVHAVLTDGLKALGCDCVIMEDINQSTAYDAIKGCAGIITSTRLQLDEGLLNAATELKWIGRMGSGMEVIDVPYATQKGIVCYSSPEGNCNAVGEHALGMLLALIRRIVWSQKEMEQGIWRREENRGIELEHKTIGIIGFGHTGRAFAKKLIGFDMRILAYDKYSKDKMPDYVERCRGIEQLMKEADIISFHVPLQEDTRHYCNDAFIDQVSKPFILINTSRGPVVDMVALQKGISKGKIIGACMDVFEQEPLTAMTPSVHDALREIINLYNVIVTPHIAGYTHESLYKMSQVLLEKIMP